MPSTREFIIMSFAIYYDLGFLVEAAGISYINPFFPSIFVADDGMIALSVAVIVASPWILDWAAGGLEWRAQEFSDAICVLQPKRRKAFYLTTILMCLACVIGSAIFAFGSLSIWSVRHSVGERLGPFVILLFVPLYILAFFVKLKESHSVVGRMFLVFLVLCSILAVLPVGERTYILLPFVVVFLFWHQISLRSLVVTGAAALLGAALLLPLFKWQESTTSDSSDLVVSTLNGDISRAPVSSDILAHSNLIGTRILDYPGAGYVYSFLFFVPRSIAPFKGLSDGVAYTAYKTGASPDDTSWVLGIGAIDELIINFGFLFLPVGLALYGLAIRQADLASQRIPSLVVPTRLAGIFLLGYHLPAILQTYGAMAIAGIVLHKVFAHTEPGPIGSDLLRRRLKIASPQE
jgi:hypothetical protein